VIRKKAKVFIVGDVHHPFSLRRWFKWIVSEIRREKPTHVIQIGDLFDQYCFARKYKYDPNFIHPEEELKQGRQDAVNMWARIKRAAPRALCYQLLGNHDDRILLKARQKFPEIEFMLDRGIKGLYSFDGVHTMKSSRHELRIDDVLYIHGYGSSVGKHARFNRCCVVTGHLHRGGIWSEVVKGNYLWELNAGWGADQSSLCFNYSNQKTTNWTLGYGLVDQRHPKFVLYPGTK